MPPDAPGETVAVIVTDWPKTDGLAEEARVDEVAAWLTVWLTTADVAPAKLLSLPSAGCRWRATMS